MCYSVFLGEPARVSGSTRPPSAVSSGLAVLRLRQQLSAVDPWRPAARNAAPTCSPEVSSGHSRWHREMRHWAACWKVSGGTMPFWLPLCDVHCGMYAYPCLSERARLRFWSRYDASSGVSRVLSASSQPALGQLSPNRSRWSYLYRSQPDRREEAPSSTPWYRQLFTPLITLPHPHSHSLHLHFLSPFPLSAVL